MTLLRARGTGEFRESPNRILYIIPTYQSRISRNIILLYGNNYENSFFFLLMRLPVLYNIM